VQSSRNPLEPVRAHLVFIPPVNCDGAGGSFQIKVRTGHDDNSGFRFRRASSVRRAVCWRSLMRLRAGIPLAVAAMALVSATPILALASEPMQVKSYAREFFADFAPSTALDMVAQFQAPGVHPSRALGMRRCARP